MSTLRAMSGPAPIGRESLAPSSVAPRRALGLIDATCVVVGAIVGVGIFFTPPATSR